MLGLYVLAVVTLVALCVVLTADDEVHFTFHGKSEIVEVRLPDEGIYQAIYLPPGSYRFAPDDSQHNLSDASLLKISGAASLRFDQTSDGEFTITASGSGSSSAKHTAVKTFELKQHGLGDEEDIVVSGNNFAFSSAIAGDDKVKQAVPLSNEATGAASVRTVRALKKIFRFPLKGEFIVGDVVSQLPWDDSMDVPRTPRLLLEGKISGQKHSWTSPQRFEVVSEDLKLSDRFLTHLATNGPVPQEAPATGMISAVPDTAVSGSPITFAVDITANRKNVFVDKPEGPMIPVGASLIESILRQSALQLVWASILAISSMVQIAYDLRDKAMKLRRKISDVITGQEK